MSIMRIGLATEPNGNSHLPAGERLDGGEQDPLLLQQVRLEVGAKLGDEPVDSASSGCVRRARARTLAASASSSGSSSQR